MEDGLKEHRMLQIILYILRYWVGIIQNKAFLKSYFNILKWYWILFQVIIKRNVALYKPVWNAEIQNPSHQTVNYSILFSSSMNS